MGNEQMNQGKARPACGAFGALKGAQTSLRKDVGEETRLRNSMPGSLDTAQTTFQSPGSQARCNTRSLTASIARVNVFSKARPPCTNLPTVSDLVQISILGLRQPDTAPSTMSTRP